MCDRDRARGAGPVFGGRAPGAGAPLSRTARRAAQLAATAVVLLGASLAAQPATTDRADRRLLMLDVGDPDRPAFQPFHDAFLRALRVDSSQRIIVHREHHDPRLGMAPARLEAAVATWVSRYASEPLDAIVANGPRELALAQRLREAWGRRIPVVYRVASTVPARERDALTRIPASAGVVDPSPIPGVVDGILTLRPGLRHLLVIGGGPGDLALLEQEAGARLASSVTIHPWVRPALAALRDSVRRLPADAVVLYVSVFTDGDGRPWIPADFLEAFADASAQPVFGLYRNLIGRGIVGGPVVDPERQGAALAARTLAVLREPSRTTSFAVDTIAGWPTVYDWAALRRHGIPERLLPRGAVVLGRPVPVWRTDPVAFWIVVALLALQSLSIVALIASRRLLRRSQQGLSALTRRLQATQETEQARLSRELHDTLGQDLLSQALDLERHAPAMAAPNQPSFAERLRRSVVRLEAIARELNPNALRLLDLRASLEQLAADLRARGGIDVTVAMPDGEAPLTPEARATVFRVVQEALANVRRHAQAAHAAILVRRAERGLEVTVRDDGVGFDVSRPTAARLGLLSMQERAAALGGHLHLRSDPDEGTTVTLTLPLAPLG